MQKIEFKEITEDNHLISHKVSSAIPMKINQIFSQLKKETPINFAKSKMMTFLFIHAHAQK